MLTVKTKIYEKKFNQIILEGFRIFAKVLKMF